MNLEITQDTKTKLPETLEELIAACRMASTRKSDQRETPIVFCKREPLEAYQVGSEYSPCITMYGCKVVEEGRLDEVETAMNLTIEQVNFPVQG